MEKHSTNKYFVSSNENLLIKKRIHLAIYVSILSLIIVFYNLIIKRKINTLLSQNLDEMANNNTGIYLLHYGFGHRDHDPGKTLYIRIAMC